MAQAQLNLPEEKEEKKIKLKLLRRFSARFLKNLKEAVENLREK